MTRVVLIGHRSDDLMESLKNELPQAVIKPDFTFTPQNGDVWCWLPMANDPVDEQVYELVELIDQQAVSPRKIVMLSMAGTADDANNDQLKSWYGPRAVEMALNHQFAIKMIDELEFPYVIVRTLPLVNQTTALKIVPEGRLLTGEKIGMPQAIQVLIQAINTDQYRNQSIGIQN